LPLLILVSGHFVGGLKRYLGLFVLLVLLAVTTSVTGIFGFACALVCYAAFKRRFVIVALVVVPIATAIFTSSEVRDLIQFVYEAKSKSIESHVEELSLTDFVRTADVSEWLLGQHLAGGAMNESFYLGLLQNYGIIAVIWIFGLLFATMVNVTRKAIAAQRAGDSEGAEIFTILACFVVGFCASSVVTPDFYDFPVNVYFWLSIFIIWLTPAYGMGRRTQSRVSARELAHA
jgi:hypothetical protein